MDRSLETAAMIMEAFEGMEEVIDYSIVAHSGDSPEIPLVEHGQWPGNEAERLGVLRNMVAHSQFCWSGDCTLQAIRKVNKHKNSTKSKCAAF